VELADVLPADAIVEPQGQYLADLMGRGVQGSADAVVLPSTVEEVAAVMRWCYEHDVPLTARGGGTGLTGGAIPVSGGVVIGFERLNKVRQFDPLLWRMHVEAGVTTGDVQRLARESGLRFPPDPGAAEISQIGGNIACNAGGPHAFKYGVTGNWVTGIEAVVPPGEIVRFGGPIRKDVAGYDLKSLLVGSEGTLGLITAAWLRLTPAPELELPVVALYRDADAGVSAIERVLASGVVPAAIEYMDGVTLDYSGAAYPFGMPEGRGVHGDHGGRRLRRRGAARRRRAAGSAGRRRGRCPCAAGAFRGRRPVALARRRRIRDPRAARRRVQRGHRQSRSTGSATLRARRSRIGARHDVPALSFGHAGDGNIHSTFLFAPDDPEQERRADAACHDLFELALRLGGTVTGEHGIGWLKRGQLEHQLGDAGYDLHLRIKQAFDPKGLLNPGKKR
jgi:FAD/FMN-containing dehydrogenases